MSRPSDHSRAFTEFLVRLVPDPVNPAKAGDPAALATFRRALGSAPDEDPSPYRYLGRWVPGEQIWRDRWYFLVAGLFALHRVSWPVAEGGGRPEPRNLGASFRQLIRRDENARASVERRFVALLNCQADDLPHHLRLAVSLLKARDVPVDWAWLLDDLLDWEQRGSRIRREWARSFWGEAGDEVAPAGTNRRATETPAEESE